MGSQKSQTWLSDFHFHWATFTFYFSLPHTCLTGYISPVSNVTEYHRLEAENNMSFFSCHLEARSHKSQEVKNQVGPSLWRLQGRTGENPSFACSARVACRQSSPHGPVTPVSPSPYHIASFSPCRVSRFCLTIHLPLDLGPPGIMLGDLFTSRFLI